jgi:hypothetical protein
MAGQPHAPGRMLKKIRQQKKPVIWFVWSIWFFV